MEHHHADRVSDDVVQLARDPSPLLRHCDPRRDLASAPRARSRPPPPSARRAPGARSPRASSSRRAGREDEVVTPVVGDVVDDDGAPPTASTDPRGLPGRDAGCRGAGRRPSRKEEASPVGDEQSVEEGQCRAESHMPAGAPRETDVARGAGARRAPRRQPRATTGLRLVAGSSARGRRPRSSAVPTIRTSTPCLDAKRHALPRPHGTQPCVTGRHKVGAGRTR